MCGITGVISQKNTRVSDDQLNAMVASLHHRGPDDRGVYIDNCVGLGQTRLSIVDLSSAGRQPMRSRCGRYTLVYNGEIYNASQLKGELTVKEMRGHSDTEILLEGLIQHGPKILSRLNGMFAFAFYDRQARTVLLVRDRFGIKPLYIAEENGIFRFGSEIKSLFAGGLSNRRMRRSAMHEFLYFGVSLGATTLFESIDRLLPGHAMQIDIDTFGRKIWCFNRLPDVGDELVIADPAKRLLELLDSSVQRHLISDVPVAVFLSGGIDSSAITALASKYSPERLISYSVGFDIPGGINELPAARIVARQFGTDHRELHIEVGGVQEVLECLSDAHDLPFGDAANIPLYLLCKELAGDVKVVLQGDGGDEIFGGYSRYRWLSHAKLLRTIASLTRALPSNWRAKLIGPRAVRVLDAFLQDDANLMALLLTEEVQDPSPTRVLTKEWRADAEANNPFARYVEVCNGMSPGSIVQRMLYTDTQIILPDVFLEKVDRSTMAHGIEVRVPFLDTELTEFALRLPPEIKLPNGKQKGLLKSALRPLLPGEVLDRRKTGFSVPFKDWLSGSLGDWLLDLLREPVIVGSGIFDEACVRKMLTEHRQGRGRNGFLLYKILVFALWIQRAKVAI